MTAETVHRRYLTLVDELERDFLVARWRWGDVDLWPLARMDLYLDMFRQAGGDTAPGVSTPLAGRVIGRLATPLTNLWLSRRDLGHWVGWPGRAHAIVLGDGVSLDRIEGAWQDRYGEPVIAALEQRGLGAVLMHGGGALNRLPWRRPTFAANVLSAWGTLAGALPLGGPAALPDHADVMQHLARRGVAAPSLAPDRLARRARVASATASAFERVLRSVQPKLAFVVTYYAGLGHAFALACRRQRVLCVDLQHCPREGAHKAYGWSRAPEAGYSTLPAVFWTWTDDDASTIERWAGALPQPWHRSLHGGHTQLATFLDDDHPQTRAWDAQFAAIGGPARYEREILVALQPIGGYRAVWDALAAEIEAAPATWRWWIRRHPSASIHQDTEYRRLLVVSRPNVLIEEASALPLPALLRHMSAVLSLTSGAATEAVAFGAAAFFLIPRARGQFERMIERGEAKIIDVAAVNREIAGVPGAGARSRTLSGPDIQATLLQLEDMASDYARLCERAPMRPASVGARASTQAIA